MNKEIRLTKKRENAIILPEVKDYIFQSNAVTNVISDYSLYQERVLTAIIYYLQEAISLSKNGQNYKQLELFRTESITLNIPLKEISKPRDYPKVKNAIKKMSVEHVSFSFIDENGKQMEYTSGLFSAIMPTKGNGGGSISVKFEPVVADILIKIQKDPKGNPIHYTRYMYQIAQSVKTAYTSKIYKLISSWKKKGAFYISKKDLYERLGVKEGEYKDNFDFMRRVIIPSHNELFEKADCWFNCKAKDFIKKEGDKPRGAVIGFNFKVITPEYMEGEDKKVDQLCYILRTHFGCTDNDIAEIMPIFEPERFNYRAVADKITTVYEKLDSTIHAKNKYIVTALLNEFIN